jgi:hypothetical protein
VSKDITAELAPLVTETFLGGLGKVTGIIALEGDEFTDGPSLLIALTIKVYDVPLVSPVTITDVVAPVATIPSGFEVTS